MNKKSLKIILTVAVAVVIIAGVVIFFAVNNTTVQPATETSAEKVTQTDETKDGLNYSEPELRKMIDKVAKERFGNDAFVIFLSSEGPTEVEIHGTKRTVYIYAADSVAEFEKNGKIRGLYHVDADTGEIFDNGSGTMEKISIGE